MEGTAKAKLQIVEVGDLTKMAFLLPFTNVKFQSRSDRTTRQSWMTLSNMRVRLTNLQ